MKSAKFHKFHRRKHDRKERVFSSFACLWRHTISRGPRAHAYQRPTVAVSCSKFVQKGKSFWALMSYLKSFFWNIRTHVWRQNFFCILVTNNTRDCKYVRQQTALFCLMRVIRVTTGQINWSSNKPRTFLICTKYRRAASCVHSINVFHKFGCHVCWHFIALFV